MYYPFMLYHEAIVHRPLFSGLSGNPYVADLSRTSALVAATDTRDQRAFQKALVAKMTPDHTWGFSPYLERRDTLLADCPQMTAEERFFHLGVDIIVPVATPLHAPLAAVVAESDYESGDGNYGGFVLLRHDGDFAPFYSLYGHLDRARLPEKGTRLSPGEPFAAIGDFADNGNWFHHTHLQVITPKGLAAGYLSRGYCSEKDLASIMDFCPSPMPLFRR